MSMSVQPELVKRYKDSQICSTYVCRMRPFKIWTFPGIKLCYQHVGCLQKWSWKDCRSQNYKTPVQLQTVVALYGQETVRNNGQTSNSRRKICKTSYWSDDENSKLQSPKRSCGKRISHQESKRKESPRREESDRVCWVESTWTMFERRLM